MKCSQLLEHLGDLLDGDPAIARKCERHLRECKCCAHVLDSTRKMIDLYKRCEPKEVTWRKLSP